MSNTKVKAHYQNTGIAREYDRARFSSLTGRTFDALEKHAIRRVLSRVLSEIPNPRTLDVPCGTGRITLLLLEEGLNVTGGDISEAMMEVAREKCASVSSQVTFRRLDLEALDLPDQSFPLITCIRLFHHLQTLERTAVLKELSRVSSRFVLINVSFSSPYYGLRRRIKRRLGQGISRTSSTWAEILAEAKAAGLRVACTRMVLPGVSEDMIVLLEKLQ